MRLLLASKSAARRRLLETAGVPFATVDAAFREDGVKASLRSKGVSAAELALELASAKALAVKADTGDLVLGSDQTLELEGGTMLDKPGSQDDLFAQLQSLSGRTHWLHAAAALVHGGDTVWSAVETVELHVRPLGAAFLRDYVAGQYETVRWSVGGYHVEGKGAQLFDRIEGSHFAVQGLPLLPLLGALREHGLLPT